MQETTPEQRKQKPACRDSFLAKVPRPCPVRHQVTPANFIAGPSANT